MTAADFRALLKAAGLRQNRLAALLGVNLSTVNRWCSVDGREPLALPVYAVVFVRAWLLLTPEQRATFG